MLQRGLIPNDLVFLLFEVTMVILINFRRQASLKLSVKIQLGAVNGRPTSGQKNILFVRVRVRVLPL